MGYLISRILIISLCVLIWSEAALACRFNVRETGFVDIGDEHYFLVAFIDHQTPASITASLTKIAEQSLAQTNINFELVDLSKNRSHPAVQYLDARQQDLPRIILISPNGHGLEIEVEKADKFHKSFEEKIKIILSSPIRDNLQNQIIEAYGVVMLIEGRAKEANLEARNAAGAAIQKVTKKMDLMPKAIKEPPELLIVSNKDAVADPLLLWVLGLKPENLNKPHAVVFYGRARWLGPLFRGEEITKNNLGEILLVVGADCECGLDKNWLRGTMLPMRWNKDTRTAITENLGFDPENPLIKIEVSQIMQLAHYATGRGIPSPEHSDERDTTDHPRQGIGYADENAAGTRSTEKTLPEQPEESMLPSSLILSGGILALLLAGGSIFVLYRRKLKK